MSQPTGQPPGRGDAERDGEAVPPTPPPWQDWQAQHEPEPHQQQQPAAPRLDPNDPYRYGRPEPEQDPSRFGPPPQSPAQGQYGQSPYGPYPPYGQYPPGPPGAPQYPGGAPHAPQPPPYASYPQPGNRNGLAVAGLVLGLVALALCWVPIVGAVLGVLGVVFGAVGLRSAGRHAGSGRGLALAGTICGAVATVVCVVFSIFVINRVVDCSQYGTDTPSYNLCIRNG